MNRISIGVGVGLGGNPLEPGAPPTPDPGYDIVLLLGQSNTVGYTTDEAAGSDLVTDARIKQLDLSLGEVGSVVDAVEHLLFPDPSAGPATNPVSPGLAYAKLLLPGVPEPREILLVPCAEGATTITDAAGPKKHNAGRYASDGTYIGQGNLTALALAALNAIGDMPGTHEVVAIIWGQGESDAIAGATSAQLSEAYRNTYNTIRKACVEAGFGYPPIVMSNPPPEVVTAYPALANMMSAYSDVEAKLALTSRVTANDAGYDDAGNNAHWDRDANRTVRPAAYVATATAALANTTPDATVPAALAGLVEDATDATTIDLSWTMSTRATDYRVRYRVDGSADSYQTVSCPTNSVRIAGLEPATAYEIIVEGRNAAGLGTSATLVSTTDALPAVWAHWTSLGGDFTTSGSDVTAINDQGASNRDAAATGSAAAPALPGYGGSGVTSYFEFYETQGIECPYPTGDSSIVFRAKMDTRGGEGAEYAFLLGSIGTPQDGDLWGNWGSGTTPDHKGLFNVSMFDPVGALKLYNHGQNSSPTAETTGLADLTWYVIAVVFDDTAKIAYLYVDGVLVDSGTYPDNMNTDAILLGFSAQGYGHRHFHLSDVRVYNSVLPSGTVAHIATQIQEDWA